MKRIEGPPKLVKYLLEWQKARNRGATTSSLEEYIHSLFQNESEVLLAMQWVASIDRLPYLAQYEQQLERDLVRQASRTDLTRREALELAKAIQEKEEKIAAAAQRQLEIERERNFRGYS